MHNSKIYIYLCNTDVYIFMYVCICVEVSTITESIGNMSFGNNLFFLFRRLSLSIYGAGDGYKSNARSPLIKTDSTVEKH